MQSKHLFRDVTDVDVEVEMVASPCPLLWSRLKYQSSDGSEGNIGRAFMVPRRRILLDFADLLSFIWCHHEVDICGFERNV